MRQKNILKRLPNMAFLCGANKKDSMRYKFLNYVQLNQKHIFVSGKATTNIFSDKRIIIAEQVEKLWDTCLREDNTGYDNLLEFEIDIAELASVIPIFLEGPGAMVETGAFFSKPSLKKKLLIILDKDYFNRDSFIQRAIVKDASFSNSEKIIYYDSQNETHNQKIFEKIFSFRDNYGQQIDTQNNNLIALYFFLVRILCGWKTKEQIIKELEKDDNLKKYKEKLDNHLKILVALGLIIEESDFTKNKFLSLIRKDCSVSSVNIFNQVASDINSNSILLKYMKRFVDQDCFSYSYQKHFSNCYKWPNQQLKALQKILQTRIFNDRSIFPIHTSAMAYIENSDIKKNAEKHYKNQFILKLDFKYFFNSIKKSDFIKYLKNINFYEKYINFISDITFKDDNITKADFSLPIGSSTSPVISNMLLYPFDEKISKYSDSLGITYTRYADDLIFSHNQPNKLKVMETQVRKIIKEVPYPANLQINDKKTVHMSKKGQRRITGLYITPEGKISIGRNKKNYIKKLLRDYEKGRYEEEKEKHIQGYLKFIKNVEREFWNRLHDKYIKQNCYTNFFLKLFESSKIQNGHLKSIEYNRKIIKIVK